MGTSLTWNESFPKGFGHTSIAHLRRCPGFEDAKNGDLCAAKFVVSKTVKIGRIIKLREKYPNATLLPVNCKNKLPLALGIEIGLPIWKNVFLVHTVRRKLLSAIRRLLHKPIFIGYIQENVDYILVDDIITQGGTVATLREFVINHGGNVVAIVALAFAIGSHAIAPLKKYLTRLMIKFGVILPILLQMFGIARSVYELTNSQVKYLLRFSSINNIEKKIKLIRFS